MMLPLTDDVGISSSSAYCASTISETALNPSRSVSPAGTSSRTVTGNVTTPVCPDDAAPISTISPVSVCPSSALRLTATGIPTDTASTSISSTEPSTSTTDGSRMVIDGAC